jgi:hypothetical protein
MGRLTGIFVMFAGIGIIGALASILASLLVAPGPPDSEPVPDAATPSPDPAPSPALVQPVPSDAVVEELARLRAEIAELREALTAGRT